VIVVGVDGSTDAERAAGWAVDEAKVHGDTVLLVHVWQYPAIAVAKYAGDPLPIFGHEELQKLGAEVLADARDHARNREPSVGVETRLIEGHPAAALVDASGQARLLVIGSRGLGGFKGMLMGSVSSSCARHARCPVVIVPPVAVHA